MAANISSLSVWKFLPGIPRNTYIPQLNYSLSLCLIHTHSRDKGGKSFREMELPHTTFWESGAALYNLSVKLFNPREGVGAGGRNKPSLVCTYE
jgi:hypothetical protein